MYHIPVGPKSADSSVIEQEIAAILSGNPSVITMDAMGTQKAILDYLKEHTNATRQEVAEALGNITEDGVKYNIGKLQQYGRLKRENGRKSGSWVVIDLEREEK